MSQLWHEYKIKIYNEQKIKTDTWDPSFPDSFNIQKTVPGQNRTNLIDRIEHT